jgi:hypothetical protein
MNELTRPNAWGMLRARSKSKPRQIVSWHRAALLPCPPANVGRRNGAVASPELTEERTGALNRVVGLPARYVAALSFWTVYTVEGAVTSGASRRLTPPLACRGPGHFDSLARDAFMLLPRFIRLRDAPGYLGMDRNRFNAEVRPWLTEIAIGIQGIAFDRLDLDRFAEEYKQRNGRVPEKEFLYGAYQNRRHPS